MLQCVDDNESNLTCQAVMLALSISAVQNPDSMPSDGEE